MLGILVAPQYLAHGQLSLHELLRVGLLDGLPLLAPDPDLRGWRSPTVAVFGLSAGLGLVNKPSMTVLPRRTALGLLVTPQRRLLFNRWAPQAIALIVLLALPNLLWQIHNHWPTLEFLHNGRWRTRTSSSRPLPFLSQNRC